MPAFKGYYRNGKSGSSGRAYRLGNEITVANFSSGCAHWKVEIECVAGINLFFDDCCQVDGVFSYYEVDPSSCKLWEQFH
jgi:hypothetical protein